MDTVLNTDAKGGMLDDHEDGKSENGDDAVVVVVVVAVVSVVDVEEVLVVDVTQIDEEFFTVNVTQYSSD